MKVFYNRTFKANYPVGASAVVVAHNAYDAADQLEAELRAGGLEQPVKSRDMIELELVPQVVILQNGDY